MIHTDGSSTTASSVLGRCERCWEPECGGDCGFTLKPIVNRDPGDEHHESRPARIPMRCLTCDRYCGGRCPTAIRKEST